MKNEKIFWTAHLFDEPGEQVPYSLLGFSWDANSKHKNKPLTNCSRINIQTKAALVYPSWGSDPGKWQGHAKMLDFGSYRTPPLPSWGGILGCSGKHLQLLSNSKGCLDLLGPNLTPKTGSPVSIAPKCSWANADPFTTSQPRPERSSSPASPRRWRPHSVGWSFRIRPRCLGPWPGSPPRSQQWRGWRVHPHRPPAGAIMSLICMSSWSYIIPYPCMLTDAATNVI